MKCCSFYQKEFEIAQLAGGVNVQTERNTALRHIFGSSGAGSALNLLLERQRVQVLHHTNAGLQLHSRWIQVTHIQRKLHVGQNAILGVFALHQHFAQSGPLRGHVRQDQRRSQPEIHFGIQRRQQLIENGDATVFGHFGQRVGEDVDDRRHHRLHGRLLRRFDQRRNDRFQCFGNDLPSDNKIISHY